MHCGHPTMCWWGSEKRLQEPYNQETVRNLTALQTSDTPGITFPVIDIFPWRFVEPAVTLLLPRACGKRGDKGREAAL